LCVVVERVEIIDHNVEKTSTNWQRSVQISVYCFVPRFDFGVCQWDI